MWIDWYNPKSLAKAMAITGLLSLIIVAQIRLRSHQNSLEETNPPTTTDAHSPTTHSDSARTTVTNPPPPEHDHNDFAPPTLTAEPTNNPELAALAVGCGWWSRPLANETPQELAQRLAPHLTNQLRQAIAELRPQQLPMNEIEPGAVEALTNNTWRVHCSEWTLTRPPQHTARTATIKLTSANGTWTATQLTIGQLTLP